MTEEALAQVIARLAEIAATLLQVSANLGRDVRQRAVDMSAAQVRQAEAETATLAAKVGHLQRQLDDLRGGVRRPRMLDTSSSTDRGPNGAQRPSERAAGGSAALANSVGCKVTEALVFLEASPAVLEGFAELWRGEIRPWLEGQVAAKLSPGDATP